MSEIRLVTSSDEHVADLNPGFRKDNYRDSILQKVEWQGHFARKFGADCFLRGGDYFHVKAANKTTKATLALSAKIHRSYSCPVYSLAGNHDMSNNDPDSIPRQPIGVMYESGVFQPLKEHTIKKGSLKVRIVGIDYTTDLDYDGLKDLLVRKDENYLVAVVHALAAYQPEERIQNFFNERILDYRDLIYNGCPDAFVFGHYHKDQGVQTHHGVHFINLGALSRGALTFENLERKPKTGSIIINSQGISVEEHVVPHEDASEIFDLEKKKQIDKEKKDLSEFIGMIRSQMNESSSDSVKDKIEELRNGDYPEDLKDTVEKILESVEEGLVDEI